MLSMVTSHRDGWDVLMTADTVSSFSSCMDVTASGFTYFCVVLGCYVLLALSFYKYVKLTYGNILMR